MVDHVMITSWCFTSTSTLSLTLLTTTTQIMVMRASLCIITSSYYVQLMNMLYASSHTMLVGTYFVEHVICYYFSVGMLNKRVVIYDISVVVTRN
jgi:hypothetical protein